jgi:hypothetical protein
LWGNKAAGGPRRVQDFSEFRMTSIAPYKTSFNCCAITDAVAFGVMAECSAAIRSARSGTRLAARRRRYLANA